MSRNHRILATVVVGLACSAPANGQLGVLTATLGSGQLLDIDDDPAPWRIGTPVEEGDRIITEDGGYAMLFFVSGIAGAEIEFDGVIVVEVDADSEVEIRGRARRRAPIDIHVRRGGVQAFFDAREHRDYILLSTPDGEMRVTGSHIYATVDRPEGTGSVFGTFDSDCTVEVGDGTVLELSRSQKVVVSGDQPAAVVGLTAADVTYWESLPDLHMAAALSSRGGVRSAYAGRTWVREYVTGDERLEDVAREGSSNIPDQAPEIAPVGPATTARVADTGSTREGPRLRSARTSRLAVDDDELGVSRDATRFWRQRNRRP